MQAGDIIFISIHPMLRFNFFHIIFVDVLVKFQYILCYGSTTEALQNMVGYINFNTSYVTVQQLEQALSLFQLK